jgi:hypothetical protein
LVRVVPVWRLASHHLEQHEPQRVDVRPRARRAVLLRRELLRRAVLRRERAEAARGPRRDLRRRLALLHRLSDPEVQHLDARAGSAINGEQVRWLDVPVRDPHLVGERERLDGRSQ